MKKFLLPESGNFYKANLHCHTNVSDGKRTPAETKEVYKSMGYSVIAYTDHNILVPHDDLTDSEFLALNGYELDVPDESRLASFMTKKTCHICFIAKEGNSDKQPCYHEPGVCLKREGDKDIWSCRIKLNEEDEYEDAVYSGEYISNIIKNAKEKGFFVTYNHPTWSLEGYDDYINYEGIDAFEMFNGGCLVAGYDDYNPRVYDDLLLSGKKIFCIGADDNHGYYPGTRKSDEGVAFTVIKAEELTYPAIIKALENGGFYSSVGPEIYELYLEDGKVHIKCSDADRIIINYGIRWSDMVCNDDYSPVNEATFDLPKSYDYFRITVIDKRGRQACTNAYFMEDVQ